MEEATVREEKFHIYLNDDEYSRVIQTLTPKVTPTYSFQNS